MTGTSWVPGALVLAVGLLAGWIFARRLRRGGAQDAGRRHDRDRELEIADLEARRDEIYERLREDDLDPADRDDLERAAARTLLRLDELGVKHRKRGPADAAAATPETTSTAPPPPRHFFLGFAYGAGLILVVGALIYWAVRDAKPDDSGSAAPMASATTEDPHTDLDDLPPQALARMQSLSARLEADPGDIGARRELSTLLLSLGRFFDAYEQAESVLGQAPEDPDALYVQAVVRLTMGQIEPGAALLERALATNPRHLESLIARGIAHLQSGDRSQALAVWERGLEAAGGQHDGLERLLTMTRAGKPVEEILRAPRAGDLDETPPAQLTERESSSAPPPAEAAASDYRARIVLAPGIEPPPGAILFVYLRPGESGAPVAVRRIANPRFPLDIVLGAGDAMMGGELPPAGSLIAKLDTDGSASTSDPRDLEATAPATAGTNTLLTLGL